MNRQTLAETAKDSGAPAPLSWRVIFAVLILAGLTIVYLSWPVWRASFPIEIDVNEAWNAFHADQVLGGKLLYPKIEDLVSNNYPPLSFFLVAAISSFGIEPVYVGRALSIASTAAIAFGIIALLRSFGALRFAACIAAVWFVGTLARFYSVYLGMNDPSLPALAVMVWALVWCLRTISAGRSPDAAIVLMVLAGFYKHNLVAIPLAALIWIAWVDREHFRRAMLVGTAAMLLGFAICGAAWGMAFFDQLLTPRQYNLVSLGNITRLQWIAPALLIFALFAPYDTRSPATRFVALFATISFFSFLLQKLGEGVADNAQFEVVVATALGLGVVLSRIEQWPAAKRLGYDQTRFLVLLILVVRLLASTNNLPYRTIASPAFRSEVRDHARIAAEEAERVRAIPGEVACSVTLACRFAGKSYRIDRFNSDQKVRAGRVSREQLHQAEVALGLRFEEIDPRATARFP